MIHGSGRCAAVGYMSAAKTAVCPPRLDHAPPGDAWCGRRSAAGVTPGMISASSSTSVEHAGLLRAARSSPAGSWRGCARADAWRRPTRRDARRSAPAESAGRARRRRRALGEAADVIEVQVAGQHDVDVVDGEPGLGQRVVEVVRAVEAVDVRALGVHLVAAAGVDEQRPLAAHDQRPHAERDAVAVVGRQPLLPQRPRHDAEHRAAVEAEEAVGERDQLEVAERMANGRAKSGTVAGRPAGRRRPAASARPARRAPPTDG